MRYNALFADAKYYLPTQKLSIKHHMSFVTLCISIYYRN